MVLVVHLLHRLLLLVLLRLILVVLRLLARLVVLVLVLVLMLLMLLRWRLICRHVGLVRRHHRLMWGPLLRRIGLALVIVVALIPAALIAAVLVAAVLVLAVVLAVLLTVVLAALAVGSIIRLAVGPALIVVLLLALESLVEHAKIMIGVLKEILRHDPVALLMGLAGHRQILIQQLLGVSAHTAEVLFVVGIPMSAAATTLVVRTRFAAVAAPLPAFHEIQVSY